MSNYPVIPQGEYKERKDKKRWFLSPPEAVLTRIEKYSTVVKKGKNKK